MTNEFRYTLGFWKQVYSEQDCFISIDIFRETTEESPSLLLPLY